MPVLYSFCCCPLDSLWSLNLWQKWRVSWWICATSLENQIRHAPVYMPSFSLPVPFPWHFGVVVCSSSWHARWWCCCWYSWFSYGTDCASQIRQHKNDQLILLLCSPLFVSFPCCSILLPHILLYDIMHPLSVDQISIKLFCQWQIIETRTMHSM